MAVKYTFRVAEIPDACLASNDAKQAALQEMIEDMTRQGWDIAEWKLTTVGDTARHCVYVAVLFSRRDPPDAQAHYIHAEYLERRVQDWLDRQTQKLNEEPDARTFERSRLAGAVAAFEQVLQDIREAAKE